MVGPAVLLPRQQSRLVGAPKTRSTPSQNHNGAIAFIGIDIGKNSFNLVGLDARGAIAMRQKWSRGQVEALLANMPPCLIGMEACVGAHHLSRKLKALGHDARLMPAKYVRPCSKGQKNDFSGYKLLDRVKGDTAKIAKIEQEPRFEGRQVVMVLAPRYDAEAVQRPTMKFVTIETAKQLNLQALRVRERLVSQRTGIVNRIRAFLLELGNRPSDNFGR
jgi:transposase